MNETYNKTLLGNGIRIISERMPGLRSVSIGVWILTGSRNETKKTNGIAHLLEHMLFKGTTQRSAHEIAISLESLGGYLNGFTEKEFTCTYAVVLDENLKEAIEILADIVQNALLTDDDLNNEKNIVFEEIRNLEDTPEDFIQESFIQSALIIFIIINLHHFKKAKTSTSVKVKS